MINKIQVARRFGKMSHSYDEHACVQKNMAVTLSKLAQSTDRCDYAKILEIGCGTGYLTRIMAGIFPQADILATDIAPEMIAAARANLGHLPNVRFALEDGEHLQTSETFDLIISNAVFQWFNDYPAAYAGFLDRLRPGGQLLYATFGPHTLRELHASFAAAYHSCGMQSGGRHGQAFAPSSTLQQLMEDLDYTHTVHQETHTREYFPSVKDFLTSIKKIGATNANQQDHPVLSRQLLSAMIRCYEASYKEKGRIFATYHIIYGRGVKKRNNKPPL